MIHHKLYSSYDEYVSVQGIKANEHTEYILSGKQKRKRTFRKLFKEYFKYMNQGKVLCLGARDGAEVKVLNGLGFNGSMGVDLHPMGSGVVKGDWHNLPFADNSFENIYTNSFDHCLYFFKAIEEIKRVLKNKGVFIFETDNRYAFDSRINKNISLERFMQGHKYNSLFWDSINDIENEIKNYGFVKIRTSTPLNNKYTVLFFRKENE